MKTTGTWSLHKPKKIRLVVARCNFVCQDKPDIVYAYKDAARGMANPRIEDWEKLVRIGIYRKGRPRYVFMYKPQKDVYAINAYGGNVFAREIQTRKSISGVPHYSCCVLIARHASARASCIAHGSGSRRARAAQANAVGKRVGPCTAHPKHAPGPRGTHMYSGVGIAKHASG